MLCRCLHLLPGHIVVRRASRRKPVRNAGKHNGTVSIAAYGIIGGTQPLPLACKAYIPLSCPRTLSRADVFIEIELVRWYAPLFQQPVPSVETRFFSGQ